MRRLQFKGYAEANRRLLRLRRSHGTPAGVKATLATGLIVLMLYILVQDVTPPGGKPAMPLVVETVPPTNASNVPRCAPVVYFFDNPPAGEITPLFHAQEPDGKATALEGKSSVVRLQSATGRPILSVSPGGPYPPNTQIKNTIHYQDVQGGAELTSSVRFSTANQTFSESTHALGFENDETEVIGMGDFAVVESYGALRPSEGTRMAVFSTGALFGKNAAGDKSSMITLGPLEGKPAISVGPIKLGSAPVQLQFVYDFISAEFDRWVGKKFDDSFIVVVHGSRGSEARLVTSVNQVGLEDSVEGAFPSIREAIGRDTVDIPPQHTGWRTVSLTADVGRPVCITFMLTDVGDDIVSSVVALDAIEIH